MATKTGTKIPSKKGSGCLEKHLSLSWGGIGDMIINEATHMKPNPTTPAVQLVMCLYRLAHGCTFLTVGDLFGVAESTAHVIFQDVCKAIVRCLCDRVLYLPQNLEEWSNELKSILENSEFPCVWAWVGFHV